MDDKRIERIREAIAPLRVSPGLQVVLERDYDSGSTGDLREEDAKDLLKQGVELLDQYQSRLAAQDTYGVLVALQALDAGGKDSTIRHVMTGVNPQGVVVHGFRTPSADELDHDYLWRYAQKLPARGQIKIFNR
jgi:polyphosphate kinase 2 (PPK2 family)